MKRLSLAEFQKLSGISDASLVWLLNNGKLSCFAEPGKPLEVEASGVAVATIVEAIVQARTNAIPSPDVALEERISAVIAEEMESILAEAAQRLAELTDT